MPQNNASRLRLISCTLLCLTAIFNPLSALTALAAEAPPQITIGEISWAGSSLSTSDEWIELWNLSGQDVALDGWQLSGMAESGKTIILPADSTIAARSAFVIANYGSDDTKSANVFPPQIVTTTVSISNSQLLIQLFADDGSLIDQAGDGSAPPAGASLPQKITMVRASVGSDGTTDTSWISVNRSLNIKNEIADLGTPGFCDLCSPAAEDIVIPPSDTTSTEVVPPIEESSSTGALPPDENPVEIPTSTSTAEIADIPDNSSTSSAASESDQTLDGLVDGSDTAATSTESTAETVTTSTAYSVETPTSNPPATTAANPSTASMSYSTAPTQTTSVDTPKPNYNLIRLNEIMPYPNSGKEWIEIITLDASKSINLKDCQIFDSTGRIFTISDLTIDPATTSHAVIELPSSKLNNDGDGVALYSPDGQLLDVMSFGKTTKDRSWIRYPEVTGSWQSTLTPTKGLANQLTLSETALAATTTPTVTNDASANTASSITNSAATSDNLTSNASISAVSQISAPNTDISLDAFEEIVWPTAAVQPASTKNPAKTKTATAKTTTVKAATTKTATAKTSSASKTSITSVEINDLSSMANNNIRVRLEGVVGSFPGSIANHSFILLSPQGRGLLVKAPTNHALPTQDTRLVITGTLSTNDKNVISLKMATTDSLTQLGSASSSEITPQIVDLFAPDAEDAWSLVEIVGVVNKVSGQNVFLDVDGIDVTAVIKPDIKYRAKRLLAGDTVQIRGILDISKSPLRLLPMQESNIQIIAHATPAAAITQNKSPIDLPPWMPLGAAAGAIAVTEGARRFNRRRRQKKLEEKLAEITEIQTRI